MHTLVATGNLVNLEEGKEKYLGYYRDFWKEAGVKTELEAYARADDDFEYKILCATASISVTRTHLSTARKGFVPKPLVGRVTTGKGPPWKPSDTFFTVGPARTCI